MINKAKTKNIKKIILGGAQLGMKYGITNSNYIPSQIRIKKILQNLCNIGILSIDTANSYGNSEKIIGKFQIENNNKLKVITKLNKINELKNINSKKILKHIVYECVNKSCSNLKTSFLDVILLHNAKDLLLMRGYILKCLLNLKKAGLIKKIGVSVQSPQELDFCLSKKDISYIQLPFNIIDYRWDKHIDKILHIKKQRNLTIHSRSVFLQGLLLTNNKKYWKRALIKNNQKILLGLENICKKLKLDNINELCIRYVLSQKWIDAIVIGMIKNKHIESNLKYIEKKNLSSKDITFINSNRPKVPINSLNPSMWLKK